MGFAFCYLGVDQWNLGGLWFRCWVEHHCLDGKSSKYMDMVMNQNLGALGTLTKLVNGWLFPQIW